MPQEPCCPRCGRVHLPGSLVICSECREKERTAPQRSAGANQSGASRPCGLIDAMTARPCGAPGIVAIRGMLRLPDGQTSYTRAWLCEDHARACGVPVGLAMAAQSGAISIGTGEGSIVPGETDEG